MSTPRPLSARLGRETPPLLAFAVFVFAAFSLAKPLFLTGRNLSSMAFQLPELGLLTLAMMVPILSGGLNLAVVFEANLAGLKPAWVLIRFGGPEAGVGAFLLGSAVAICTRAFSGAVMGAVVAYVGAHPILVSLAMMIFLRGLEEFLTRGGDISGFPELLAGIG